MKEMSVLSLILAAVVSLWSPAAPAEPQKPPPPVVQIPKPGVPQIMTLEASFVRAACSNEAT